MTLLAALHRGFRVRSNLRRRVGRMRLLDSREMPQSISPMRAGSRLKTAAAWQTRRSFRPIRNCTGLSDECGRRHPRGHFSTFGFTRRDSSSQPTPCQASSTKTNGMPTARIMNTVTELPAMNPPNNSPSANKLPPPADIACARGHCPAKPRAEDRWRRRGGQRPCHRPRRSSR